jgi:hypothetical protein
MSSRMMTISTAISMTFSVGTTPLSANAGGWRSRFRGLRQASHAKLDQNSHNVSPYGAYCVLLTHSSL